MKMSSIPRKVIQRKAFSPNSSAMTELNASLVSMTSSTTESSESLNHSLLVAQKISGLYMNEKYSDGVLVAEQQRIPVVKSIVSQHSLYFDQKFFGNEKTNEVILPLNIKLDSLKTILKYCYSGEMIFQEMQIQSVAEIFGVAVELELVSGVSEYLESKLSRDSVLEIYSYICKYKSSQLALLCIQYMNSRATTILNHKSLLSLSAEVLAHMLSSDQFAAPELEIFKSVQKWVDHNPGENIQLVVQKLRLFLISSKDLLNVVRKANFMTEGVLMEALKEKAKKDRNIKYRAYCSPDKNVLDTKFKPMLMSGESRDANLFAFDHYYGSNRGYVYHVIEENKRIVIKLGMPSKVNHIKLLLLDAGENAYSYTVEVSLDQNEWYTIADFSKYWCRSWQQISFHPSVIQYIRIKGYRSLISPNFCIVNVQCFLSTNRICFKTFENIALIIPGHNVGTYANGAALMTRIQSNTKFESNCELLSGEDRMTANTTHFQLDRNKYLHPATHVITGRPEDGITIHLAQPYMIDRLKFLIHAIDAQSTYDYVVHVSLDDSNYTFVVEKRTESGHLWEEIRFQSQPISFIRIAGKEAYNASDRVFRLVHFECSGSPNK